jgi:hypothetical protein
MKEEIIKIQKSRKKSNGSLGKEKLNIPNKI